MTILRHLLVAALALGLTTQAAAARGFAPNPDHTKSEISHRSERARLKRALSARRAKNLAAFKAYVTAGVYPHNDLVPGDLNIWIDSKDRRCAAAQMIWASGAHDLVEQQAADDNFIRLANVTEGPLLDWILTSGLTHDEVVLIQRPFRRPVQTTVNWPQVDRAMTVKYGAILRELTRSRAASLDAAVDALMEHPELAATML